MSLYSYATWLYSHVPNFIMLRLIVAYEGLLGIKHHDLKKLGFQEYIFVGNSGTNADIGSTPRVGWDE